MLGLPILDITIGLVFIYLFLALICTAVNEIIANLFDRRAKYLWLGIERLLEPEKALGDPTPRRPVGKEEPVIITVKDLYRHPFIEALYEHRPASHFPTKLLQPLYKRNPAPLFLVKLLQPLYGHHIDPSYIPARTFALALLDILAECSQSSETEKIKRVQAGINKLAADSQLRKSLDVLLDEAGGDGKKLQEEIERWYTTAMDRVSGWYKQNTQTITLWLALVVTVGTNADTLYLYKTLSANAALREAFVAQAQELAKHPLPGSPAPSSTPTATPLQVSTTSSPTPAATPSGVTKPTPITLPKDVKPPPPAGNIPPKPPGAGGQPSATPTVSTPSPTANTSSNPSGTGGQPAGAATPPQTQSDGDRIKANAKELEGLVLELGWKKGEPLNLKKILGLLLTALAVSLGAPFWFDTLNKIVNIRAAGKSPKELQPAPPNK